MNLVILIGNLARDPEKSTTGTGMSVTRFTIAINRISRKDEGNNADFIRVTSFDKQADLIAKYLSKGSKVAVEGRIQTGSYTAKDGKTVYTTDVIANRVEFLDRKEKSEGSSNDFGGQFDSPANDFSDKADEIPSGFAEIDDEDDDMPF